MTVSKLREFHGSGRSSHLDYYVQACEEAWPRQGQMDVNYLCHFLPNRDDPLYLTVLCELVRVDLDHAWHHGEPRTLEDYQALFPELFNDAEGLREIAFEEFRLRRRAGQEVSAAEYQQRYGISASS